MILSMVPRRDCAATPLEVVEAGRALIEALEELLQAEDEGRPYEEQDELHSAMCRAEGELARQMEAEGLAAVMVDGQILMDTHRCRSAELESPMLSIVAVLPAGEVRGLR